MLQAQHRYHLSGANGVGVRCDEDGLFVGDVPLLERLAETGGWRPRALAKLDRELSESYGFPVTLQAKASGLVAVARALGGGELAKAQITALFLRLPEPPRLAKSMSLSVERASLERQRAYSGLLKRLWNPNLHPRWPSGSTEGVGGEFAPAGSSGGATTAHLTSDQSVSMPMDIPLEEPLLRPLPTEIVPPPITGPIPRNPYPARPECVKEWNDAERYCRRLADQGRLGKDPYRGHGDSFEQCVRGQISEDCGGNPVI